jgi:hypothetical protein
MARTPTPWFWEERAEWCVHFNGQRHKLGSHPDGFPAPKRIRGKWNVPKPIQVKFHELLAEPEPIPATPVPLEVTVAEIAEKFLDWCAKHRAAGSRDANLPVPLALHAFFGAYRAPQHMRQRQSNFLTDSGGTKINANVPQRRLQFVHSSCRRAVRIQDRRSARPARLQPEQSSSQKAVAELVEPTLADSQQRARLGHGLLSRQRRQDRRQSRLGFDCSLPALDQACHVRFSSPSHDLL